MNKNIIYLDNASQALVLPRIKSEVLNDIEWLCNPNSTHGMGAINKMKIEESREKIADYINAESPSQIIFTPNATCATALAFNDFNVRCGKLEHPNLIANALSWVEFGVCDKYDMYSVSYVNGEDGSINMVKRGEEKLFHSDLTSALPILPIDVQQMDLDFASFSGNKIGALSGVGVLYAKDKELLLPFVDGSPSQEYGFSGTQNTLSIISMSYAIEFLQCNRDLYYEYSKTLAGVLLKTLQTELPDKHLALTDMGQIEDNVKVPNIITVAFKNVLNAELQDFLSNRNIYVGMGTACNGANLEMSPTIARYNLTNEFKDGIIRFSFGYTSKIQDIISTVQAIKEFYDMKG